MISCENYSVFFPKFVYVGGVPPASGCEGKLRHDLPVLAGSPDGIFTDGIFCVTPSLVFSRAASNRREIRAL